MPRTNVTANIPQASLVAAPRTASRAARRGAPADVQSVQLRAYCAQVEADLRALEREDRACAKQERENRRRARERAELASIRHADRVRAANASVARRERKRQERDEDERAARASLLDARTRARPEDLRAQAFAGEKAERARAKARATWREDAARQNDTHQERARIRRKVRADDLRSDAQRAAGDAAAVVLQTRASELARIEHQIAVHERRAVLASLRAPAPVDLTLDALTHECEAIALDVSTGTVFFDANNLYHGFAGLTFRAARATLSPDDAIQATVAALVRRRHGHRDFTHAEAEAFLDRYHALTQHEAERAGFEDAQAVLQQFGIGTEDRYGKD